jgi:hypothetical protein
MESDVSSAGASRVPLAATNTPDIQRMNHQSAEAQAHENDSLYSAPCPATPSTPAADIQKLNHQSSEAQAIEKDGLCAASSPSTPAADIQKIHHQSAEARAIEKDGVHSARSPATPVTTIREMERGHADSESSTQAQAVEKHSIHSSRSPATPLAKTVCKMERDCHDSESSMDEPHTPHSPSHSASDMYERNQEAHDANTNPDGMCVTLSPGTPVTIVHEDLSMHGEIDDDQSHVHDQSRVHDQGHVHDKSHVDAARADRGGTQDDLGGATLTHSDSETGHVYVTSVHSPQQSVDIVRNKLSVDSDSDSGHIIQSKQHDSVGSNNADSGCVRGEEDVMGGERFGSMEGAHDMSVDSGYGCDEGGVGLEKGTMSIEGVRDVSLVSGHMRDEGGLGMEKGIVSMEEARDVSLNSEHGCDKGGVGLEKGVLGTHGVCDMSSDAIHMHVLDNIYMDLADSIHMDAEMNSSEHMRVACAVGHSYTHTDQGHVRVAHTESQLQMRTQEGCLHGARAVGHSYTHTDEGNACDAYAENRTLEGSLHDEGTVGSPCTRAEEALAQDNHKSMCMSDTHVPNSPCARAEGALAQDDNKSMCINDTHVSNSPHTCNAEGHAYENNNKDIRMSDTHMSSACAATDGASVLYTYKEERHSYDSRDGGIHMSSACAATVCDSYMASHVGTLSEHVTNRRGLSGSKMYEVDRASIRGGNAGHQSSVTDSSKTKHTPVYGNESGISHPSVTLNEGIRNKVCVNSDSNTANLSSTQTQSDHVVRSIDNGQIDDSDKENHSSVRSKSVRSSRNGEYNHRCMHGADISRETEIDSESESECGQNSSDSLRDSSDIGANYADVSSSIGERNGDGNIHDLIGAKLRACVYAITNINTENIQNLDLSRLLTAIRAWIETNFSAENLQSLDLSQLLNTMNVHVVSAFSGENAQRLDLSQLQTMMRAYIERSFSAENMQRLNLSHVQTVIRAYVERNFSAENMQRLNLSNLQTMMRAYVVNMAHHANQGNYKDVVEYWSNMFKTTKRPSWGLIAALTVFMVVLTGVLRILRSRRLNTPRNGPLLCA